MLLHCRVTQTRRLSGRSQPRTLRYSDELRLWLIHHFPNCQENSHIWKVCFSSAVLEGKKKSPWHLVLALNLLGKWNVRDHGNQCPRMEQSSGEEQMTKCSRCSPGGTSGTGDVAAFECKAGSTLEVLT